MAKETNQEVTTSKPGNVVAPAGIQSELERIFDSRWPSLFGWPRFGELRELHSPSVDVVDRATDILVKAEMPGFSKDDIDVSVTDNTMTIKATSESGKDSEGEDEQDGDYYLKEISSAYVARTLRLPSEVDGEKAQAKYQDGILAITVPKVAKAKRQRVKVES